MGRGGGRSVHVGREEVHVGREVEEDGGGRNVCVWEVEGRGIQVYVEEERVSEEDVRL